MRTSVRERSCTFIRTTALVVLALVVFASGCKQLPPPQLTVEGGLLKALTPKSATVKALSPRVTLTLDRDPSDRRPFTITVDNVKADGSQITPRSVTSKVLSPKSLELQVNEGAGNMVIEPSNTAGSSLRFAVIGDTQGRNYIFSSMIPLINESGVDFVIHLGDMTPSAAAQEYEAFFDALDSLAIPCYAVPGNHDVKGSGIEIFSDAFGPPNRWFDLNGWRLVFVDTSSMGLPSEDLTWLQGVLSDSGLPKLVFMHVPPFDPRGEDHAFLDENQKKAVMDVLTDPANLVRGVFSGHIHMFHQEVVNDVMFVTSGGGGAGLYASPDEGGFHHFAVIEASAEGLVVTPVRKPAGIVNSDLVIKGRSGEKTLSLQDLSKIKNIEAKVKYQNRYENFSAEGLYRGVPVKNLLDLVGGMAESDVLIVHAQDGYRQEFSYRNVFPDDTWLQHQGEMIVATSMDGESPPSWRDGFRIAFLPSDGVYDNEDCLKTSAEGQGWHLYESAGARWVKNVVRLEVKPCSK